MKNTEIFAKVTEKIIANLEKAGSWNSFWNTPCPISLKERFYNGINRLLLFGSFESPIWGTLRQINENGGVIRKGEHASLAVFWDQFAVTDEKTGEVSKRWYLRHYPVFNASQANWNATGKAKIEYLKLKIGQHQENKRTDSADAIANGFKSGPAIEHIKMVAGLFDPCYSPSLDLITMPELSQFSNTDAYYTTLFHELVHATGHPKRLNRFEAGKKMEKHDYSREELVAELGAAFLAEVAGIKVNIENSASYIRGWAKALTENTRWITWAASRAEAACNVILDGKQETTQEIPVPSQEPELVPEAAGDVPF